ncbi:hypothetical protein DW741_13230 [Ruminococcaceae bacterium AM28-23LB]|nr:hypothetical protein DW741_13230 [Ruminococcaceae bacterium AM28-23LB]
MPFPPPQFFFRSFWFGAIVPQRNQGEQEFPGGRLAPGDLFSFFIVPQFFDKLNPFFVATFDTFRQNMKFLEYATIKIPAL